MGLTKRRDSYYIEFRVIDSPDGQSLQLAAGVRGARLKRWKVGCTNKTAAKEAEAAIRINLLLGKIPSEQAQPILFSEWANTYLDLEVVKTLRSYQDRVETVTRQLVPFFGRKILSEIRPADIETYRDQRIKRNGAKARTQTINNDHIILKHMLNVAVRRGLLTGNPAARIPMPNPNNARDRVLSEEEWGKLYHAAKPHLQPVLLLAYQLGQRMSEIVGLTWDRVDLTRKFITLRGIDTKTKKPRQVPMTPDVTATLQQLAKLRSLRSRRVFLYQGKPLRDFRTAFHTAIAEACVEDFHFHDLRHCAATNLRRAGVDTTTAMQIVGHTSAQMWKRYNHIQDSDLTQAASKLGKYLETNTVITLDASQGIR